MADGVTQIGSRNLGLNTDCGILSGPEEEGVEEWPNLAKLREHGRLEGSGNEWKMAGLWKVKERRQGRDERECEGASSHLCVLFFQPLSPERIAFDMHEHMHTAPLPM